jgi:phosphoribosylformylglycinamidine synthase PurS subunit
MKAKIVITPKKAVLDPQGKTIQNALEHMGYQGIEAVHVGKYMEIEVQGEPEAVRRQIDDTLQSFMISLRLDWHFYFFQTAKQRNL